MDKADPAPAGRMSVYAPQVEVVEVPQKYIGKVIGKGGEQIKSICEQTKIDTIDINDDGVVVLSGGFGCDMASAVAIVESLTVEAEVGKTTAARVTKVLDFELRRGAPDRGPVPCQRAGRDAREQPQGRRERRRPTDVKLLETNERGQLACREVLLDRRGRARAPRGGEAGGRRRAAKGGGGGGAV